VEPPEIPKAEMEPKVAMWAQIQRDYTPFNHPSHIACTPPDSNKPPPAIRAAIAHRNCLISSTIFRFAVAHCFNADYSDRFKCSADDIMECLCNHTHPLTPHRLPRHHTRHHVLFHCPLTAASQTRHLQGLSSLPTILQSEEATAALCVTILPPFFHFSHSRDITCP
jgi:hypothetical protein